MKTSDIVALPLQLGSALRHRRVFHPLGVLAAGRIERLMGVDQRGGDGFELLFAGRWSSSR
jgi:hypothetical protein